MHSSNRTRPDIEGLEARQMLASDVMIAKPELVSPIGRIDLPGANTKQVIPLIDSGDGYMADGQWIPLKKRADRIAVQASQASKMMGGQFGTTDLNSLRTLDNGVRVVAIDAAASRSLDDALNAMNARPDIAWSTPVFYDEARGTEIVITDETIVALRDGVDPNAFFATRPEVGSYRPLIGTNDQFVAVLNVGAGSATLKATAALNVANGVAWASPNSYMDFEKFFMPNDPLISRQWHLNNTSQTGGRADADVDAPEAWNISPGGSSSIVVAVIDDGMEYTHPDLAPNLFVNTGETAGNGVDDDGNGWVDDVNGWDFTGSGSGDNDPGPSTTSDAHATSVAGVAAGAGNNALGTTGMAYNSKILPVRIFLGGNATSSANIASAVYYAAGRTANGLGTWRSGDVMNNSWGGGSPDTAITNAFAWATASGRQGKGVPTFISSGNSGVGSVAYPANLSSLNPGVISVGSVDSTDRWSYSQYGTGLDIVASSDGPQVGVAAPFFMDGIVTTDRQGTAGYNATSGTAGDYTTFVETGFGGTSSASPLVSGIAAMMLALDTNLSPANVKRLLRNTTDLVGGAVYSSASPAIPWNNFYGYGRVNAFSVLSGIGAKAIGLQSDTEDLAAGVGTMRFATPSGTPQDRVVFIRNEGTQVINFGTPTTSAGSAFSIVSPPSVNSLALGESTSFVVRFNPSALGAATGQTISLTTDVPGLATYTINLAGTGTTGTTVSGTVYHDIDESGDFSTSDTALSGILVFADANGNNAIDSSVSSFTSTQVPRSIDSGGYVGSGLNVSGLTGGILDINVTVNVSQLGPAGLYLFLSNPAGDRISLGSLSGGSNVSFTQTVFDDQAAASFNSGTSPMTGSFRPENALAGLFGNDPNGEWMLQVAGGASSLSTTITSWSIQITTASEKFGLTNAQGAYSMTNLPTGSNTIRAQIGSGQVIVTPPSGVNVVNLASVGSSSPGTNFGIKLAQSIYGSIFHDRNASADQQTFEERLSGWSVFNDANGNGVIDYGVSYPSTDVPKSIPDVNSVTSTLNLSGISGNITDLNVQIGITHTWISDLLVELISPGGLIIRLVESRGGSGDNFTGTIFDDAASASITTGVAPFNGTFRPESPLSILNGTNPNGLWTLRVTDKFQEDVGTLNSWSLIVNTLTLEDPVSVDANGNYVITGIPLGTYRVIPIPQTGWNLTTPASGVVTGAMTAGGIASGAKFGVIRSNSIYGRAFDDSNGNGLDTNESGVGNRVVYLDLNGNGALDVPQGTSTTFQSTNVPVTINGSTVHTSTLAVTGLIGSALDVNVTIDVNHTWDGDLIVQLVSPSGTVITLVNSRGGSGDNFSGTTFDDQASAAISAGSAPFAGSFRPEQPLLALYGSNPNGTWTLRITDTFPSEDNGVLNNWSLAITAGIVEPKILTNGTGNYDFGNLEAGTYAVRQNLANVTTTSSTNVPVTINGSVVHTSTLTVSGIVGSTIDLNVGIDIAHTYTSDLAIELISPTGTVVMLASSRGFDGDNFTGTIFDDQASAAISAGVAPFAGTFRPEQPLSVFNNSNPNGTWTLRITDLDPSLDNGVLNNWSLSITNTVPDTNPTIAPPNGYRWSTPGTHSAVLAAGQSVTSKDFGQAAARLQSFTVENGATQRSMVRSLAMRVDGRINAVPGSAFTLSRIAGGAPANFSVVVGAFSNPDPTSTLILLTFAGAGLAGGSQASLPDGVYRLTIDGTAITNAGIALDADRNGIAGGTATSSFHRFFGDSNGDGFVDAVDFAAFRAAYATGNANLWSIYDANGDGVFNSQDLNIFNANFRRRRLV